MSEVICTGCGRVGAPPPAPAISCCPERLPVPLQGDKGRATVAAFMSIRGDQPAWLAAVRVAELEADARRYRRLRVLGCAPGYSPNLDAGTVLRFTNLDAFVDTDLRAHPSRGEAEPRR